MAIEEEYQNKTLWNSFQDIDLGVQIVIGLVVTVFIGIVVCGCFRLCRDCWSGRGIQAAPVYLSLGAFKMI